jgi:hypothetical protein
MISAIHQQARRGCSEVVSDGGYCLVLFSKEKIIYHPKPSKGYVT